MFYVTLQQMLFLFSLIILGYILAKWKFVPANSDTVLSKLESYLFIPALVLRTFMVGFTREKLSGAGSLFLFSAGVELIVILFAALCTRWITKDSYIRKIYLYGLCFSNFGFMGNAIVESLFPEIFLDYMIFTLMLWVAIYLWGMPSLLMDDGKKKSISSRLKNLANPMFICMIIGMALGLCNAKLPQFSVTLIDSAASCMSPIAMLITGMAIAKINIRSVLHIKSIYVVTAFRLLVFPLSFLGICFLCKTLFDVSLPRNFFVCTVASLAMPLGLNTIVIPSAYGKDTTVASGMALISHVLSMATIPLVFYLL